MGFEVDSANFQIENLVIVGSGPAGYTAAIYAGRANLQPTLITGLELGGIPGGQLMTTTFVENFPGFPNGVMGPELMDLMKAQAVRWGTYLIEEDATSIDLLKHPFSLKVGNLSIKTNSLIIATGARANRLGLINEDKFWNRGISACAICDGSTPQFRKENLAVIGGGDSACEEADYLTKFGSYVHLLVRSRNLKACAALQERVASNSLIKVHFEKELIDVEGDHWLKNLIVKNVKTGEIESLDVRGLFYAIGHTPNNELFKGQLSFDAKGYIKTEPGRPETSIEGVFVAGDVADSEWRQGVTAASSGCKAALSTERWLAKRKLYKLIIREKSINGTDINDLDDQIQLSNENNFQSDALWQKGSYALRRLYHESSKPLLIIYTASECGPCHVLKPQLKRVLNELEGRAQGVEIDIQNDEEISRQAGITGTPTVQLFKNKSLIKEWKGVKQKSQFREEIIKALAN